ncbi:hypothetical protein [Burkholderia ubonensis]|nr:hypothetical protein [Burkholderia ubonensis]
MNRFFAFIREVISSGSLAGRMYFIGYAGLSLSRVLRKLIARSRLHRAWLNGHMGLFEEAGRPHGVCDREWYSYRKGRNQVVATPRQILSTLLRPFAH